MSNLLEQASLVLIPSGYKEDVVYSQIPTNGSGDMNLTRASNGTRINSAGLVEVTPWNLCEYSEELNIWSTERASVTTNATTAPNGTATADKVITDSTANNTHQIYIGPFTTPNLPFVISAYAKKSEYDYIHLGASGSSTKTWFDLNNGTVGTQSSDVLSASIESIGNGWYRCINIINNTSTSNYVELGPANVDGSRIISGTPSGGIFAWGAQLNIGSTAKPYFPTTDRLNVPRLTYQNGGGGCPSLLLEKQSTNLFTYSEQFDNANWTKANTTITANAITSPDGTQNADKIADSINTASAFYFYQSPATTSTQYTSSGYFKKGEYNFVTLHAFGLVGAVFNLNTGVLVSQSGGTGTIQSVGDGWYRCTFTFTAGGSAVFFTQSPAGNISYTGTIGSGIYAWGLQVEASSYATSYIPTTSSSATRVADNITNTFLQSGGFLGSNTGAMFVSGTPYSLGNTISNFVLTADNNTTKSFLFDTSGGNQIRLRTWDASSNTQSLISGTITNNYKLCVSWTSSSIKYFVNGSLIGTISQTTYPYTTIKQETTSFSNNIWGEVVIFPTNIADADAIALTTL
jgi:hypothetical protein